eukprot:1151807-Pelagomonas_calceolata.AAC.3
MCKLGKTGMKSEIGSRAKVCNGFKISMKIFYLGDLQPDCSADRPVTGPRQHNVHKLRNKLKKLVVVLQEETIYSLDTDLLQLRLLH